MKQKRLKRKYDKIGAMLAVATKELGNKLNIEFAIKSFNE